MVHWSYNISFPFNCLPIMGKKREKPINQPAPDPKPTEASGHSGSRNYKKSDGITSTTQ